MASSSKKIKFFSDEWLNVPEFKGWLKKNDKDPKFCLCVACNKVLHCGKTELIRHSKTTLHMTNVKKNANSKTHQQTLDQLVDSVKSEKAKKERHERLVKDLELSLCALIAEHNVAIHVVDHLVEIIKHKIPDSQIAKDINLKRTKCTAIIKNVLAKDEVDRLVSTLKEVKFSVLVDETTDISAKKQMCILVRYVCPSSGKVKTQLLQLIDVGTEATASNMYIKFKEALTFLEIPLTNIVGVASDGASVMVGKNNSFFSHVRGDAPYAVLFKCICHSAAIIASKACSKLPPEAEELIRLIYSYVSGSSKRCGQLKEIQSYFNVQHYKILKLSGTRWLSLWQCVDRILVNWEPLLAYFRIAVFEDNLQSAGTILDLLNSNIIKAYFLFLKYALNYMNSFNALFQSNTILIHSLFKHSCQLLNQFLQNFIKPILLKTDMTYDRLLHPYNYLELDQMFIGSECENFIKNNLSVHDQNSVRLKILDFYVTLAQEMLSRLPISNGYKEFEFLLPCHVFNSNRTTLSDISNLVNMFKPLLNDPNAVMEEWRHLPFSFEKDEVLHFSSLPVDMMWKEISKVKDYSEKSKFVNICQLANIILTLPHSNAESERTFSMVTDIKTKKRNSLGDDTLNAICIIRSSFKCNEIDCTSFCSNENHLKLFTSDIYRKLDNNN